MSKIKISLYILIMVFSGCVTAQKSVSHHVVPKCHDNGSGVITSFNEVQLFQVGRSQYKIIGRFLQDGTNYLIPVGGVVSFGLCSNLDSQTSSSSFDIVEKCHNDENGSFTSFYQVVKYDESGLETVLSSFTADGNQYSIPGTGILTLGFCPDISNNIDVRCVEYDKNLSSSHVIDYTLEMSSSVMIVSNIQYLENGETKNIYINYPYDLSNKRHRKNIVDDLKNFFDCKKITYQDVETEVQTTGDLLTKVIVRFKRPSVAISKYYYCLNKDLSSSTDNNQFARNVVTNGSSIDYTNKVRAKAYYTFEGDFLYVSSPLETVYSIPSGMKFVDCDINCDLENIAIEEYIYKTRLPVKTFVLQTNYGSNLVKNVELQIWKVSQVNPIIIPLTGYSHSSYAYSNQLSYHVSKYGSVQSTDVKVYGDGVGVEQLDSQKIYLVNVVGIDSIKSKLSNDVVLTHEVESEKDHHNFTVIRNKLGGINAVIGDNGQKRYSYLPHGSQKVNNNNFVSSTSISGGNTIVNSVLNVDKCHDDGAGLYTSYYEVTQYDEVGNSTILETYNKDGSIYNVPGTGVVNLGFCDPLQESILPHLNVEKCHDNGFGALTSFYELTRYDENGNSTVLKTFKKDGSIYNVPGPGVVNLGFCKDVITSKCISYSKNLTFNLTNSYTLTLGSARIISRIRYGGIEGIKVLPLNYPYDLSNSRDIISLENDIIDLFNCKGWVFKELTISSVFISISKPSISFKEASFISPQTFFQVQNIDGESGLQNIDFVPSTDNASFTGYVHGKAYYKNGVFTYLIDDFGDISYFDTNMIFVDCLDCDLNETLTEKYKLRHVLPLKTMCIDQTNSPLLPKELVMFPATLNGTILVYPLVPPTGSGLPISYQIAEGLSTSFVYGDLVIRPNGANVNFKTQYCLTNVGRIDSMAIIYNDDSTIYFEVESQNDYSYLTVLRNKLGGIKKVISEIGSVHLSYLPPGSVPFDEPPSLVSLDTHGTGLVTIPGHFKSINILCVSNDVTINGVAYNQGYIYNIPFIENGTIANEYVISGSNFNYTVFR